MFDLRRFRKDHKLTQTDIAFMLGCGQPNIVSIERNNRGLSQEQINMLEEKFGDLSYYESNDNSNNNEQYIESFSNWNELTSRQQATIDKLLDLLEKEKEENAKLSQTLTELTKKVIEKVAV